METIYGYLERVTYYNEENSFMVARLKEKGVRINHDRWQPGRINP